MIGHAESEYITMTGSHKVRYLNCDAIKQNESKVVHIISYNSFSILHQVFLMSHLVKKPRKLVD